MRHSVQGKGFTLIELLVVIAIVAVLSAVLVITLNPAELLKQARDSNRISDLNTLKSAIAFYMADASTTSLGTSGTCYESLAATTTCPMTLSTLIATTSRKVDGTGWVPVNLSVISSGAPISALPIDPLNTTSFFYAYAPSSTGLTFEIDAKMESAKYASSTSNVVSTDGGNNDSYYEVGTNLTF